MKRQLKIFGNAWDLCGVDMICRDVMFSLLQTAFLRGLALVDLMDVVINYAKRPEETVKFRKIIS